MRLSFVFVGFIVVLLGFESCKKDEAPPVVLKSNIPCIPNSLAASVVAFYPFSSGSINDFSGNNRHLENTTDAFPSSDRNGNQNCAFEFNNLNGSESYLINRNTDLIGGAQNYSISFWYNSMDSVNDGGDYQILVRKEDRTEHCYPKVGEFTVALYDCRKALFSSVNSVWDKNNVTPTSCQDEMDLRFNSWHHLAVSFSVLNLNAKIYRDGILQESETGAYVPNFCNDVTLSGVSDLVLGENFTGKIDDVVIFNKRINAQEVNAIMLMGSCCE